MSKSVSPSVSTLDRARHAFKQPIATKTKPTGLLSWIAGPDSSQDYQEKRAASQLGVVSLLNNKPSLSVLYNTAKADIQKIDTSETDTTDDSACKATAINCVLAALKNPTSANLSALSPSELKAVLLSKTKDIINTRISSDKKPLIEKMAEVFLSEDCGRACNIPSVEAFLTVLNARESLSTMFDADWGLTNPSTFSLSPLGREIAENQEMLNDTLVPQNVINHITTFSTQHRKLIEQFNLNDFDNLKNPQHLKDVIKKINKAGAQKTSAHQELELLLVIQLYSLSENLSTSNEERRSNQPIDPNTFEERLSKIQQALEQEKALLNHEPHRITLAMANLESVLSTKKAQLSEIGEQLHTLATGFDILNAIFEGDISKKSTEELTTFFSNQDNQKKLADAFQNNQAVKDAITNNTAPFNNIIENERLTPEKFIQNIVNCNQKRADLHTKQTRLQNEVVQKEGHLRKIHKQQASADETIDSIAQLLSEITIIKRPINNATYQAYLLAYFSQKLAHLEKENTDLYNFYKPECDLDFDCGSSATPAALHERAVSTRMATLRNLARQQAFFDQVAIDYTEKPTQLKEITGEITTLEQQIDRLNARIKTLTNVQKQVTAEQPGLLGKATVRITLNNEEDYNTFLETGVLDRIANNFEKDLSRQQEEKIFLKWQSAPGGSAQQLQTLIGSAIGDNQKEIEQLQHNINEKNAELVNLQREITQTTTAVEAFFDGNKQVPLDEISRKSATLKKSMEEKEAELRAYLNQARQVGCDYFASDENLNREEETLNQFAKDSLGKEITAEPRENNGNQPTYGFYRYVPGNSHGYQNREKGRYENILGANVKLSLGELMSYATNNLKGFFENKVECDDFEKPLVFLNNKKVPLFIYAYVMQAITVNKESEAKDKDSEFLVKLHHLSRYPTEQEQFIKQYGPLYFGLKENVPLTPKQYQKIKKLLLDTAKKFAENEKITQFRIRFILSSHCEDFQKEVALTHKKTIKADAGVNDQRREDDINATGNHQPSAEEETAEQAAARKRESDAAALTAPKQSSTPSPMPK